MKKRKLIGVICLLAAVFFLAMTLQFVFAQEGTKPTSKEIEIVPDKTGSPTAVPSPNTQDWKSNPESYNSSPFSNLTDNSSGGPSNYAPPPTPPPPPTNNNGNKTVTTGNNTPAPEIPTKTTGTEPVVNPPVVNKKKPVEGIGAQLFKYKGVLWNGSEYVGIITSEKKSFIARNGEELEDGYKVLFIDDKGVILVKEGVKSTLHLQEVEK